MFSRPVRKGLGSKKWDNVRATLQNCELRLGNLERLSQEFQKYQDWTEDEIINLQESVSQLQAELNTLKDQN